MNNKLFSVFIVSLFESAFFCFLLFLILFLGFFIVVFIRVWFILKKPLSKKVLSNYIPRTGDVLMSQWRFAPITSLVPFVKYFPTHVGLVWNRKKTNENCKCLTENKDEIYIIEMNHFRQDKNLYAYSQNSKKGLRVIRYYDFIDEMEGILYTRQIENEISSKVIEDSLNHIQEIIFEPRVSRMTWEATFSIGWSFVIPEVSQMCANKLKFNQKQYPTKNTLDKLKPTFFCSEFVIWFLQYLGYINPEYKDFYSFSPGCFMSFTKKFENLYINNSWKEEEIVLKRY